MTKEDIIRLHVEWRSHPAREFCGCANHDFATLDVCIRERAWRTYCKARDQYIIEHKRLTRVHVGDTLNSFEDIGE